MKSGILIAFWQNRLKLYFCILKMTRKTVAAGTLAQSVEQRTENPCVPGSIPGGTTFKNERPSI